MYWSKNNWRLPALSRWVPMSFSRASKGARASKYSRPSRSLGCKSRRRRLAIFASLPSRQSPGTHEGIAQISCQHRAKFCAEHYCKPAPTSKFLAATLSVVLLQPVAVGLLNLLRPPSKVRAQAPSVTPEPALVNHACLEWVIREDSSILHFWDDHQPAPRAPESPCQGPAAESALWPSGSIRRMGLTRNAPEWTLDLS